MLKVFNSPINKSAQCRLHFKIEDISISQI